MENKINIWTWNFWYFNFSLLEILNYLEKFNWFNWVEIVVKHGYKFSETELKKLKKYKYNTLHLLWFKKNDIEWIKYCIKTIPDFHHFTLHPDDTDFTSLDKDIEKYISFENMDTRKKSHQTPEEMINLFKNFPEAWFTFDINHAEENKVNYKDFDKVKFPNKIHFSVVNKNYYQDNPEIETPHSLASLEKWFNFNLKKYKDIIITLEWVFVPWRDNLIQDEINLVNKLLND